MKALVIYDSLYGNTEEVAGALASGTRERGAEIDCVRANAVDIKTLEAYDRSSSVGPPTSLGSQKQ